MQGHIPLTGTRNARSVWHIATAPSGLEHFAAFPPALVERCLLAGTSAHGVCSACQAPWERVIERTVGYEQYAILRLVLARSRQWLQWRSVGISGVQGHGVWHTSDAWLATDVPLCL